ncbi:MAG: TonB-dependent siderophore receptor [Nostoc sp.]|uniref:TonB-dependent siderophore receptor n=1 Tax=Nostoc sp. TaxID=1180 RepID=UPI002FFA3291
MKVQRSPNLLSFVVSLSGCITSVLMSLVAQPVWAQSTRTASITASTEASADFTQLITKGQVVEPVKKIQQLRQIKHLISSAQQLVQSPTPETVPTPELVQVTEVKANPTSKGVEVILQTSKGQELQITNRSAGNNFIADIPNAQLRLLSGEAFTFRSEKPIQGVTEITVTNFDTNTIRVTVIGEASLPAVELYDSPDEGLIFSVATAASSAQKPQTQPQPENQTQQSQPSTQNDQPIELVVTGEQDGYNVPDASSATRTDTPIRDIPQSIQVVPRQVIEDRVITDPDDAVRTISGVIPSNPSYEGGLSAFSIRGFDYGSNVLRNGVREIDFGSVSRNDLTNIERVEILKGPASVLYGQGSLGGAVNIVTKQPLRDPFYNLEFLAGSYDLYRGAVDFSGPLNDSRTVLYRLNAFYQDSNTFIDFSRNNRWLVNPVVSWQISPNTKLTIEGDVSKTVSQTSAGLPAVGTVLPNPNGKIPINRFIGEPGDFETGLFARIGYDLQHQFSKDWSVRNVFRYAVLKRGGGGFTAGSSLDPDGRTLDRFYFDDPNPKTDDTVNGFIVATDLTGKFETGSIKHTLLFGTEVYNTKRTNFEYISGDAAPLDLFNPVYGSPRGAVEDRGNSTQSGGFVGVYLQDQIALADNLKLVLGGRYDWANQDSKDLITDTKTSQSDEAFSPRVGIVYQPIQPISLYASYSRSFNPNSGTDANGNLFDPESGTQYEVGIKGDLSNKLSATLALFDLTRSNVLTTDPNNSNFSIQTGKQRSRGIELDISGEILPGWSIAAGYAYIDARISEDNDYAVGNRLVNAPENSFGLFTSYKFQSGSLEGWGLGLGFFYVGEREGDLNNNFTLPSYFRTDASIFYKRDRLRAAVSIKNLFNVDYYESSSDILRVFPGEPLTVQGTISWQF